MTDVQRALVDDIPVIAIEPSARRSGAQLALWMPFLSGTKEACIPFLEQLAEAGFVAVSLDPWLHGERATQPAEDLFSRVFADFRRAMWPILGHTTLDAVRVIDWALETFDLDRRVVTGGVSMGGDIAVAAAGIDPRITRVAAIVSTPDWTRPGMRVLDDPTRVLPQGEPDTVARWYYDRLDPFTHLDAYVDRPAITFECGADDTHVPPEGARRFQAALQQLSPAAGARIRVNQHPGLGHLDAARTPALAAAALDWLTQT